MKAKIFDRHRSTEIIIQNFLIAIMRNIFKNINVKIYFFQLQKSMRKISTESWTTSHVKPGLIPSVVLLQVTFCSEKRFLNQLVVFKLCVDFANILRTAFTCPDPKCAKRQSNCQSFYTFGICVRNSFE